MSNDGLSRAAAALALEVSSGLVAFGVQEKNYPARKSAWEADYGKARTIPFMDPPRHDDGDSRDRNGYRNTGREGWTYRRVLNIARGLWVEMMSELCPGTRVLVVCIGIVAFIVVV